MTSYIDQCAAPAPGVDSHVITHSWAKFTAARLAWLYGEAHFIERRPATQADIAAWRRLGSSSDRAA